ncbi:Asp-tRNA(Asn)/Glu-tRNA(Gln) amidotransferase subunit GatA [Persicimonas caeni]|uniref:Glutamyl-tRNA(Gln) amidotransferase subunit A n=1 Tax=Persicimonas caeni TaxID=2292766 RepID=A0A4Y6PRD2_PERCE|nr:Asp-tRNA(Asn)/Glu-tRNA(Gln) amidotransferase subunit GatA [Persicimonas caeni]QDG50800.1 Asp-tRNA(Asn)/Glu-tRNA(Gln) amidotransferase subunit GatA [Persicimonas caeni]QED32021.1 Asp-tRNA(Asn)/Glu-tRNA(Gln) amidotransferase subunit GatA [Persicimonas caeni]
MSLNAKTISELIEAFEAGEATAEDAAGAVLDAIEAGENLNAFISVRERDAVLAEARAVDEARQNGAELGALAGVPVAVKDNLCVKGGQTTAASRMLAEFEAPYSATVVERLQDAGAILVGKTNLDEFAMGSSNENSFFGPALNPHDPERVPGGSSGGSAVAVAANQCVAALGSDTGGSIRQPASHCGVVGVKPTYGRVSRYGLIAFASSLDQVGPLTRSVDDAARLLEVICGFDPRDATSARRDVPKFTDAVGRGVEGLKLGVPKEYFASEVGVDDEVGALVRAAIDDLEAQGAELVEVSLPHTEYAVATYYLIATAEASSNLARYDGARYGFRAEGEDLVEMYENSRSEGFGDEVKRRIMLGTYVLSAGYYDQYYGKAQQVRTLIRQDFDDAFDKVDAIVAPTAPTPAFALGDKSENPLQMYLEDIFTISCNLAGLPGMSVPCGATAAGLPVGLQVLAPAFDEETMLAIGAVVEA